jgi:four helix bundle protein
MEEIGARTKLFAVRVERLTAQMKAKNVDYVLRNQFLRSGTSIGANVREGKASSSRKELIRYYEIALRSANETAYWLEVIEEGCDLGRQFFEKDKQELGEISKVIASIVIKLKQPV